MKNLIEYINEAINEARVFLDDVFDSKDGIRTRNDKTFVNYQKAENGKYYDFVIKNGSTRAVEVTCPSSINNIEGLNCDYFIAVGAEEASQGLGVDLVTVEPDDNSTWQYNLNKALRKQHDGATFFWGSYKNDLEYAIKQTDDFFKRNKVNHLIVGYAKGVRDPKYHLNEIVKKGNGYDVKSFDIKSIDAELYNTKSNWLVEI